VERGRGEYLWLRDREENPTYLEPDYYVCMRPQTPFTILKLVTGELQDLETCDGVPLVRKAANGSLEYLQHRVVARDVGPLDSWAIVKLDWDYPPFLRALGTGSGRRFLDVTQFRDGSSITLRFRYEYAHQKGLPEQGTTVRLEGLRPDGSACVLTEPRETAEIAVPDGLIGRVRIVVTPHTATKAGPEYVSDEIIVGVPDPATDPCPGP
jgi:hypothetical protein